MQKGAVWKALMCDFTSLRLAVNVAHLCTEELVQHSTTQWKAHYCLGHADDKSLKWFQHANIETQRMQCVHIQWKPMLKLLHVSMHCVSSWLERTSSSLRYLCSISRMVWGVSVLPRESLCVAGEQRKLSMLWHLWPLFIESADGKQNHKVSTGRRGRLRSREEDGAFRCDTRKRSTRKMICVL